jgi:hypothetical protein
MVLPNGNIGRFYTHLVHSQVAEIPRPTLHDALTTTLSRAGFSEIKKSHYSLTMSPI